MLFKIGIRPAILGLLLLGAGLMLPGCSSSPGNPLEDGRAQGAPLRDASSKAGSATIARDEQPEPDSLLEKASALSGYRSQSGDPGRPFVKFPNELYQYENNCYKLDMNTPFTGIAEIDRQLDNWSDGLRNQSMAELNESCVAGAHDLFMQLTYETSVTRGQTIGMIFFAAKYTGGAHPITEIQTMNFNVMNGSRLQYPDIFAQTDGLYEFLSDYAYRALRPGLDEYWNDGTFTEGLAPKAENFKNFVLTPDGLVLVFPQYQVAPYAAGIQTCLVPLASLVKFQPRPGVWQ
jgi:hypothetical protein